MPQTPVDLDEYFNTLVEVQTSLKCANELQRDIAHHLGNGAMILQGVMKARQANQKTIARFNQAVTRLQKRSMKQADKILVPVKNDTMRLKIPEMRYASLMLDASIPVRKNHEALIAFKERLGAAIKDLQTLRKNADKTLYVKSGLKPVT